MYCLGAYMRYNAPQLLYCYILIYFKEAFKSPMPHMCASMALMKDDSCYLMHMCIINVHGFRTLIHNNFVLSENKFGQTKVPSNLILKSATMKNIVFIHETAQNLVPMKVQYFLGNTLSFLYCFKPEVILLPPISHLLKAAVTYVFAHSFTSDKQGRSGPNIVWVCMPERWVVDCKLSLILLF
jgi:hypothetical protein